MIQLTLTLKMTTAQVVQTSVTVNKNSPIQDYVHPDHQTQPFVIFLLVARSAGDGTSQREWGGGGEREEKTPARKHCENEKHPLVRHA